MIDMVCKYCVYYSELNNFAVCEREEPVKIFDRTLARVRTENETCEKWKQTLEEESRTVLSDEDWELFVEMLNDPKEPSETLKKAAQEFREEYESEFDWRVGTKFIYEGEDLEYVREIIDVDNGNVVYKGESPTRGSPYYTASLPIRNMNDKLREGHIRLVSYPWRAGDRFERGNGIIGTGDIEQIINVGELCLYFRTIKSKNFLNYEGYIYFDTINKWLYKGNIKIVK